MNSTADRLAHVDALIAALSHERAVLVSRLAEESAEAWMPREHRRNPSTPRMRN